MLKPKQVRALPDYRIWVRFEDGVEGEVDLSKLAGKGLFSAWNDKAFFETVHVTPHGSIAWNEDLELCSDSIYLELTGGQPEQLPRRATVIEDA